MPRRNTMRRFEPRYGVSATMIEVEAKALGREVDDYEILAPSDVEQKLKERHEKCKHSWEHLGLLLAGLSEREQRVIYCLLYRDFYHILELYLCHVRARNPALVQQVPRATKPDALAGEFREWLFDR